MTNNEGGTLHSFIKLIIANNNMEVNVYVFSNIVINLISKNNFDSNIKRKIIIMNTYPLNIMKKNLD